MPKDPIAQEGSAVLRKVAKPVAKKEFGSKLLGALVARMSRVLAKEEFGVALAAPQVGVSERLFVIAGRAFIADLPEEEREKAPVPPDMVFINPRDNPPFARQKRDERGLPLGAR
jgi:peptide deformylase